MQYGQRYKIRSPYGEVIEAEHIQTKGDDERFPTFRLDNGSLVGISQTDVLGEAGNDDAPSEGIGVEEVDFDTRPDQDPEPGPLNGK